jgi:hypothetical protein
MDFGKAFSYVFEDPDWIKKIGIAGAIALVSMVLSVVVIGIIGFIPLIGWMLEIMRRVINRDPQPLAGWDDFGAYFSKGLQGFVVALVYTLPLILINACAQLIPLALAGAGNSDSANAAAGAVGIVSICLGCLSFVYGLFVGIVMPAALGTLAATGQIGAAFRFGDIFGMIRSNPGPFIIAFLGSILAGIIGGLGVIACVIGVAFTYAYSMAIQAHLYGQAYSQASASRGVVSPM